MSTQRSHHGCWTCKDKRRRCDKARPTCETCRHRGQVCEGYEVRLRWGTGIASRGRFTGADKPLEESVPARPRGRKRDLRQEHKEIDTDSRDAPLNQPGVDPDTGLQFAHSQYNSVDPVCGPVGDLSTNSPTQSSPQDQALFEEFLRYGINVLHSTTVDDSALGPRLPQLCQQSRALYAVCIAFQVSLSARMRHRFREYYQAAIATFRAELSHCVGFLNDGTWNAGLILCTIGMMNGESWTIHLGGMQRILLSGGLENLRKQETPFRRHLLEVLGVMDLPTFTVGRRTPYIGIWNRYCRDAGDGQGIELVTGLPRSLLNIFSRVGLGAVEEDFWNWPGEQGDFLQCYLWEAHRLAGMLTVRRSRVFFTLGEASLQDASSGAAERDSHLPKTEVLLTKILANLDAIRRGCKDPRAGNSLIMNAINYPLFVAGQDVGAMNSHPDWKQLIRDCYCDIKREEYGVDDRLQLKVLEELWKRNDAMLNVNDLAREMNLELGLL